MTIKILIFAIGFVIISCFYAYLGYVVAEERFNNKIEKLKNEIENLNNHIHFLQIELISERRSKINVTIQDSREER